MSIKLTADQQSIFDSLIEFTEQYQNNMVLVTGYAGTGKTTLINEFIKWFTTNSKALFSNAAVTAPTHKAVKVLKKFAIEHNKSKDDETVKYTTLHSLLGLKPEIDENGQQYFVKDPRMNSKFALYDLIIIDESSMIDDKLFAEIMSQNVRNSKIIFVGDPEQIPPVGQNYAIPFIKEKQEEFDIKVFSLTQIMRQAEENPIIRISQTIRNNTFERVDYDSFLKEDSEGHGVYFLSKDKEKRTDIKQLLKEYFTSDNFKNDADYAKVIAWRNKTVDDFNRIIRKFIYGDITQSIVVGEKLIADKPIFDPILNEMLISTNEDLVVQSIVEDVKKVYDVGIKCYKTTVIGDDDQIKVIDIVHESSSIIFKRILTRLADEAKNLPKGQKRTNAWKNFYETKEMFAEVKYNYAITAHKSQGSTYNNTFVIASDINVNINEDEKRRILYTACTRPKERLFII